MSKSNRVLAIFTDHYELIIQGLRIWVSLGCSPEERFHRQPVDVDIKFCLSQEPLGCKTDDLNDVLCYKTIVEQITESTQNRSFNLIEFLAAQIFETLAGQITFHEGTLEVTIAKPNHPVPHANKPMIFKYCRRLPQKHL